MEYHGIFHRCENIEYSIFNSCANSASVEYLNKILQNCDSLNHIQKAGVRKKLQNFLRFFIFCLDFFDIVFLWKKHSKFLRNEEKKVIQKF